MKSFDQIRKWCTENYDTYDYVVERLLFPLAYEKKTFERKFVGLFKPYEHILSELPEEFTQYLTLQYMAHDILKATGRIHKIKNYSAIRNASREEREYIDWFLQNSWRFSFAEIESNPSQDFYNMKDVLTGDQYLLFSPGITKTLNDYKPQLWFNLIHYNGDCRQSYGPIGAYQSFTPDDIFFFATEVNPDKDFMHLRDVQEEVEENPVPFMMLLYGSNMPLTYHKDDPLVYHMMEVEVEPFKVQQLDPYFLIKEAEGVYKLELKNWNAPPHFSIAYYDEEEEGILVLTAMTRRGHEALVDTLNQNGFLLPKTPDFRVTPAMLSTAGTILKKEVMPSPYEELFQEPEPDDPEAQERVDKLNHFLGLIMPEMNEGKEPDLETHASNAGLDMETARELYDMIKQKTDEMKK